TAPYRKNPVMRTAVNAAVGPIETRIGHIRGLIAVPHEEPVAGRRDVIDLDIELIDVLNLGASLFEIGHEPGTRRRWYEAEELLRDGAYPAERDLLAGKRRAAGSVGIPSGRIGYCGRRGAQVSLAEGQCRDSRQVT